MKFKQDDLREIVTCRGKQLYTLDDGSYTQVVSVEEEGGKHDSTNIYVVFSHSVEGEKKFYGFDYEVSYNEGLMSDYWSAEEELEQLIPQEQTIITYVRKPKSANE
jgi:hypothetical protein